MLTQERDPERITEAALQRFHERKLEPPTVERLDRLIRSTLRASEDDFVEGCLNNSNPPRRLGSTGFLNFRRLSLRVFRYTTCAPTQDLRVLAP